MTKFAKLGPEIMTTVARKLHQVKTGDGSKQESDDSGSDSDDATSGADGPATNHPAQRNPSPSSESDGGESTEKKRHEEANGEDDSDNSDDEGDSDDEDDEAAGDLGDATGGADNLATNHPAQRNLSPSPGVGGGKSTEKKRRCSKPGSKTAKTHKHGGASFHSSAKAALNFSAPLLNASLADHEQTPDQRGLILFRTAAFSGTRKKGENCALGTLNFYLGDSSLVKVPDLTETSKKLYGE